LYLGTDYELGGVSEIDLVLEESLPIAEAAVAFGNFLPANAVLEQTFYAIPTPTGPIGLRTHIWSFPDTEHTAISLMYVDGDEEAGTVSRILMAIAE
jgi:hypothetical protein